MTQSAKQARITLANILVSAGYDPRKVLDAIGFPLCKGIVIRSQTKPDDDYRVTIAGRPIIDYGRNVGAYDAMSISLNDISVKDWRTVSTTLIPIGADMLVETYDGWGGLWKNTHYEIIYLYTDNETVSTVNGDSFQGVSSDSPGPYPWPGYYKDANGSFIPKLWDYYRNGTPQSIPPPKDWKLPDFLPLNS